VVLRFPDFQRPFILRTDASATGIGAVLFQKEGGLDCPIEFASRKLSSAERNYSTIERELLAIVWAVQRWRSYLFGKRFTLFTDHAPLQFRRALVNPNSRLTRWALILTEYDFEITHVKGELNVVADALSRSEDAESPTEMDIFLIGKSAQDWATAQREDPELFSIIQKIEQAPQSMARYKMEDNILWYQRSNREQRWDTLVVPKAWRSLVLEEEHDHLRAGHRGAQGTHENIRAKYYWPQQFRDAEQYVASCAACQRGKDSTTVRNPMGMVSSFAPNELVAMDILTLPERNGFQYVLVIGDLFSRFIVAVPLAEEILADLRIKKLWTSAYHPQTDGMIERFNRTLISKLRTAGEDYGDWPAIVSTLVLGYNSSLHETTKYTPFFLFLGRRPPSSLDAWRSSKEQSKNTTSSSQGSSSSSSFLSTRPATNTS
jgi:transposase InsO family protein